MGTAVNATSPEVHHIASYDISNFEFGQGAKLLEPSLLLDMCQRSASDDIIPSETKYTDLQDGVDRRFDAWIETRLLSADSNSLNTTTSARGRRVSRVSLNEDERWKSVRCFHLLQALPFHLHIC